jgi:hypothetical protein
MLPQAMRASPRRGFWKWNLKSSPMDFDIALKLNIEASKIDALFHVELEPGV